MILSNDTNNLNNLSRLKWACRRGMLELDVLLENFVNEAYLALAEEDKKLFVAFLTFSDPELFAWLLGSEVAPDPRIAKMATMIRQHAYDRFHS